LLRWRLLLGALFIATLAGWMRLDYLTLPPGAWLLGLTLVVGLAAAGELVSLFAAAGYHPLSSVVYGGTALVILSNALPLWWRPVSDEHALERLGWPLLAFMISCLVALLGEMRRYSQPGKSVVHVALAIFSVAYLGLSLSFAWQLRVLGGQAEGMVALAALVMVVKMGDTGAYTVGRLIGKHKMAPRISPGKTIEGGAGALSFACLGAWIAFTYLPGWMGCTLPLRPGSWLIFGLVVGLAGLLGDLAESLIKRDLNCKDSSSWLPGFGGVLDLVDSILFTAPIAYLCWLLLRL